VAEAEGVVREVEAQAGEAAARLELASREFASLPPDQLDQTGNPKPRTEAARLAGEIRKLKDPPVAWSRRLDEARRAARMARIELDQWRGAHVVELARADEPEDRQAAEELRAQVNGLIATIKRYQGVMAKNSALVSKAPGLDPQVELPGGFSDRLSNVRRDLQRLLPEIVAPLPRSIFPREGETPPRVQAPDGGWVGVQHVNVEEERQAKRDEQEAREQRRPVRWRPPQPEPAPGVAAALQRRGWE
jgi:hypothetical protein